MNSTMKIALPIGLFALMIFGVTWMSQYTAPTQAPIEQGELDTALPLEVGSAEIMFNPMLEAPPQNRFFPGYFEVGTDGGDNRVGFVVRNRRSTSAFLTALVPSCATCTSARAAAIPADALRNYFQHAAIGPLWSPMPSGNLLGAIAWAQVRPKLRWHEFAFNDTSNKFELPGAAEPDGETWGIVELGFKMAAPGAPLPKQASFDVYDARGNKLATQPFTVYVGGREAQELNFSDLALPELSDSNPTHAFEIVCVSATRHTLPPPVVSVGNQDPHVVVANPIPMSAEELMAISRAATTKTQNAGQPIFVNFRSGYRIQGAIHRDANGRSMDVGPYEKLIYVGGGPGIVLQKPASVRIHGDVVGAVRLEGATKIDFGSYDGTFAQKKEVRLWTERKGLELEVAPNLAEPSFLKPSLGKPSAEADRTYWTLAVQIPAKEGRRPPWDGFVYLRTKGEKPITIRIQVSGHGR